MTILYKILLFYGVAGVIVGAVVATGEDVNFRFGEGEKQVWFPRSAAFVFCAVFWPAVFWNMIFKG